MTSLEVRDGAEALYLTTPRAIRDRAEAMYALAASGKLRSFTLDEGKLGDAVDAVIDVTRAAYPDVSRIPYHARYRHFGAGGVDRLARLDAELASRSAEDRLRARVELVVTSVLLDAGAGAAWSYRDADGRSYARSEGLAVASYDLFESGGLSDDRRDPLRADAAVLSVLDESALARAFQVAPPNPLIGLEGRATVLRKLGEVVLAKPAYFGQTSPRLGNLGVYLTEQAKDGVLPARAVLAAVLDALGDIWPGRVELGGRNLGDVWPHPDLGLVPFHKLSQWLSYSLAEPLEQAGVRVVRFDELTGLAEYRNGGLFIDAGVLVPRSPELFTRAHAVSSTEVVEWRALTIALLDRTATEMRRRLGLSEEALPLARVLEGGTWAAGRKLAAARRPGGPPPLVVESDGTVF
ncbi:MAG TPA: URC4/urg3 family protein [Polyangiaceae bacterium]|nr:URC4/urg3 family protein [Polyangiaceae bacterium]